MKILVVLFCLFVTLAQAAIPCAAEAEAFAIADSKKKGNLPHELLSRSHPTEMNGKEIVVYIGARAAYNYYELRAEKDCKISLVDVEYVKRAD